MKFRILLILLPAGALAILALFLARRGSVPGTPPRVVASEASSPADPRKDPERPLPKVAARPKRDELSRDARLFAAVRGSLRIRVKDVLDREGPRAAYTLLLQELEKLPTDLEGRVRRAYVFRFLPWLVAKDPTLEADVLLLLERHAGTDADPYARFVALSTLFDCSVIYTQPTPVGGFFFARIDQRLTPQVAGLDQGVLELRRRDLPRLIALALELYGRDLDRDNRQLLVELVAAEKKPDTIEFLSGVARNDVDVDVRYCSIEGLAAAGKSPATIVALQRSSDDADPRNRLAALDALVRLGACDDLVVSRLLTTPVKSGALYQVLGQAYAATAAPALGARLRESLGDAEPRTRRMALHGIVRSGSRDFLVDLEPALAREKDPDLKREIQAVTLKLQGAAPPDPDDSDEPGR